MGQVHIGTLDFIDRAWDTNKEVFPLTGWEIRQLSHMARKYLESIATDPPPKTRPAKTEQFQECMADDEAAQKGGV